MQSRHQTRSGCHHETHTHSPPSTISQRASVTLKILSTDESLPHKNTTNKSQSLTLRKYERTRKALLSLLLLLRSSSEAVF